MKHITIQIDTLLYTLIKGLVSLILIVIMFHPATAIAQEITATPSNDPVSSEELTQEVLGLELAPDQNSATSAKFSTPTYVTSLFKNNYQVKEKINITVKNLTKEDANDLDLLLENVKGKGINALVTKDYVNEQLVFTINPEVGITPGKYRIKVVKTSNNEILSDQSFTWGLLSVNTNKSIYLPGENAKISLTVLDEDGKITCNAQVDLEIKAPFGQVTKLSTTDGSVKVNPGCRVHNVTNQADYVANYQVKDVGRYILTLTSTIQDKTYTIKDRFEVRENVPFEVERIASSRLYAPEQYPVRIKIKANRDFSGKIVEAVPQDFQIRAPLRPDSAKPASFAEDASKAESTGGQGFEGQADEGSVISYSNISTLPDSFDPFKEHNIPELLLPFKGEYPVTLGFGQQIDGHDMELVYKKSGIDGHDGIDFAVPKGTPIIAVDAGKVILAKENWIYGHTVVIQHSWGRTYYGHLSEISVVEGATVAKGQQLGLSGSTGLSTGPHLHFGLKPNTFDVDNLYYGKVDPAPYLGLASVDSDLSVADYPMSAKALVWSVNVAKGASFEIGYDFKAPNRSPYFYSIGQLQFISAKVDDSTKSARFDVPSTVPSNGFVLGEASSSAGFKGSDTSELSDETGEAGDSLTSDKIQGQVIFEEIRQWQMAMDSVNDISVQRNTFDVDTYTISQNSPQDFTEFGSAKQTFIRNLNNGKLSSKVTTGAPYDSLGLSGSIGLQSPSSILFNRQVGSSSAATNFSWESWEYNGVAGGPNEFKVISRNSVTLDNKSLDVKLDNQPSNINKAIPFITGIRSNQAGDLGSATAIAWLSGKDTLNIERGSGGTGDVTVDVVTVEFTGSNWKVAHADSGLIQGDSGRLNLVDSADGVTPGGGQIGNWGNAVIFHGYRSGSESVNRDTDLLATYKPSGASSVSFDFNSDHEDQLQGRHFVHILKNDIMSVTRLTDSGDKVNSSNLNIASANLKDLYSTASDLSCSVSAGSDFGSGIRNGRVTSTASFEHSSIGSAKGLVCEIQIIDLFSVENNQTVSLNQVMRHGKVLAGGQEGGFVF